jgi:hypothetical protein
MNAIELKWELGHPTKPGKYIFRHGIGLDLPPSELIFALHDPISYKWRIVDVRFDENSQWLVWADEKGVDRVCNTLKHHPDLTGDPIWFAEFPGEKTT